MDTPELPVERLEAGRAYNDALNALGFEPEGLMWAYDHEDEIFRLWLVWSGLDHYGPLAISTLLFKAYNSASLPREIDPFYVYVVTPEHMIGALATAIRKQRKADADMKFYRITENGNDKNVFHSLKSEWIYHLSDRRYPMKKITKDWRAFNENVTARAA